MHLPNAFRRGTDRQTDRQTAAPRLCVDLNEPTARDDANLVANDDDDERRRKK